MAFLPSDNELIKKVCFYTQKEVRIVKPSADNSGVAAGKSGDNFPGS